MIDLSDYTTVGKFQKPHALLGELNAVADVEPDFFEKFPWIIVAVESIPTPFYVSGIRPKGHVALLLKMDGVNDVEEARNFVNKDIYVSRSDLRVYECDTDDDTADDDGLYADDLSGFDIYTPDGVVLGRIEDMDNSIPDNPMFIVCHDEEMFMVPVADEYIVTLAPEQRRIVMLLPDGLLDINRK